MVAIPASVAWAFELDEMSPDAVKRTSSGDAVVTRAPTAVEGEGEMLDAVITVGIANAITRAAPDAPATKDLRIANAFSNDHRVKGGAGEFG